MTDSSGTSRRPGTSRREFLLSAAAAGAVPAAAASAATAASPATPAQDEPAASAASSVTTNTIAEAEKLAGVSYTDAERQLMLDSIEEHLDRLRTRQAHPLPGHDVAPAMVFDPRLPGRDYSMSGEFKPLVPEHSRPPLNDEDIAYAPLHLLSYWVRKRDVRSQQLTRIYLNRLRSLDPQLECVVTLIEDQAMAQARRADITITAGHARGPLHGIPWGAKDLFDTANVPTTWGAGPFRDRVPTSDANVVRRLEDAGAVLIAKLTLGALAYGDIWFGGLTRNPWNTEQGSSGSSAGSASATAAGSVGFSLGTETYGSIVSPCMRCGVTGLRPTFGRVGRSGAMPLCWSLDKVGPICRSVEDCMLVLNAINGPDPGDPASIDMPVVYDAERPVEGMRVGFDPRWFENAHGLDREVLTILERLGVELVEIGIPDWPYDVLLHVLFAEAAAAFEELTRSGRDDELKWQDARAWPNSFRRAWFVSAPELVQADRLRRQVMEMLDDRFQQVDAMVGPSFAGSMLLMTNFTGHPSLTVHTGFKNERTPHGITFWGRLFDEGTLANLGSAVEREVDVMNQRPALVLPETS
jgi:Asp-tRNA(Asn)/Glu-tRNA(Gln) amidotransferase A subunit family amidase